MVIDVQDINLRERLIKQFQRKTNKSEFVCSDCKNLLPGSCFEVRIDFRSRVNKSVVTDVYRLKRCIDCQSKKHKKYYAPVGARKIDHRSAPEYKQFRKKLNSEKVYCRKCETLKSGEDFLVQVQHRNDHTGKPYLLLNAFRMCRACWNEFMKAYQRKRYKERRQAGA